MAHYGDPNWPPRAQVLHFGPEPDVAYTIDHIATMTGVTIEGILRYEAAKDPGRPATTDLREWTNEDLLDGVAPGDRIDAAFFRAIEILCSRADYSIRHDHRGALVEYVERSGQRRRGSTTHVSPIYAVFMAVLILTDPRGELHA